MSRLSPLQERLLVPPVCHPCPSPLSQTWHPISCRRPGFFPPAAARTYGTGADEVQGCCLSLRGVTTTKATGTAWKSPSFGYFNNIEHWTALTGFICQSRDRGHNLGPQNIPHIPARALLHTQRPGSQRKMEISFTALKCEISFKHNYLNLFIPGQWDLVAFLLSQNTVDCHVQADSGAEVPLCTQS